MRELTIRTPWAPSVNTYWRHNRGRTHISAKGKAYKAAVQAEASRCYDGEPMTGRLKVLIRLYPPDRRRRDIDNSAKAILDALGDAGIYKDDEQIDDLQIKRCLVDDSKQGAALVTITAL